MTDSQQRRYLFFPNPRLRRRLAPPRRIPAVSAFAVRRQMKLLLISDDYIKPIGSFDSRELQYCVVTFFLPSAREDQHQSVCTLSCSRALGWSDRYLTAIIDVVDMVSYPEYMRVMIKSMICSSVSFSLVPSSPVKRASSMSSWT
uniref:Uncharacterized protein n=1 Tax=Leersia perrieri TaxID=77586 RepID=A0A0D9VW71_9ORYZ